MLQAKHEKNKKGVNGIRTRGECSRGWQVDLECICIEWFDAQDAEETDELLAAIDEGVRSAETERTFSLEEVRAEIKKWATKSA